MQTFDLDQLWPTSDRPETGGTPLRLLRTASNLHRRAAKFLRSFDPQAAVWLSLGFMAGMVAWHAVGFWGFVSDTVLHGPDRGSQVSSQISAAPPASIKTTTVKSMTVDHITTGSLQTFSPRAGACMALTRDVTTGETLALTCAGDTQPMRDAGRRRRGDRLATAGSRMQDQTAWRAATALDEIASQDPPAESDFDLTLSPAPQTSPAQP
jgi:hypothetical protein